MYKISILRVFCQIFTCVICAVPLLIIFYYLDPVQRGFFCSDTSIRYPYVESTVSVELITAMSYCIPISIIILFETLHVLSWEKTSKSLPRHIIVHYGSTKVIVHRIFARLYVFVGYFLLGAIFNQTLAIIAKFSIGRLRPHFLEVCDPRWAVYCDNDDRDPFVYNNRYTCSGDDDLIREARFSFYSAHSAFAFYAALFTIFYLQARVYKALDNHILLLVIQFTLLTLATFCAYSRVFDFHHHWSDVLFGAFVGSFIAIVIVHGFKFAKQFDDPEHPTHTNKQQDMKIVAEEVENGTRKCGGFSKMLGSRATRPEIDPTGVDEKCRRMDFSEVPLPDIRVGHM